MAQLKRITPKTLARLLGIMYFVFGALFSLLFGILEIIPGEGTEEFTTTEAIIFIIAVPLFYGALGWVGGYGTAWMYNSIARRFGGIEFEVEHSAPNHTTESAA